MLETETQRPTAIRTLSPMGLLQYSTMEGYYYAAELACLLEPRLELQPRSVEQEDAFAAEASATAAEIETEEAAEAYMVRLYD